MGRRIAKADVIPVRQPNQYACVTTSLCMALRALGVPEDECSPARVNKVVGAMPLQGAAWEPMLAAANHYGMRATLTLPSTVRQLKEWTDAGKPVVIAWNPEGREWSHASLVFDVDDDLNVYVADPNIPDPDETVRVVPKGEFYSKWYEKAPQGFLIRRPACVIEREITPDGRQVMASRGKTNLASRVASRYSKQAESKRLDQGARREINSLLIRAGLDGNGRFRSAQQGYARAVDVLQDEGIELDEVVSSHLFNQPSGTIRADIAFTNYADRFSPISIDNSVLYLSYTELRDGVYEVVAYLS